MEYGAIEDGELEPKARVPYGRYAAAAALVVLGATSAVATSSRSTALFESSGSPRVRVNAYADAL